jgi:hypothetical protein
VRGDKTTLGATELDVPDAPVPVRPHTHSHARRGPIAVALWVIALALVALAVMVGITLFLPSGSQPVLVQFSDLSGRVQLEYCPSLPASFEAIAHTDDLQGGSSVIPVKVSAEVCGDSRFNDGVWIYLHRSSVTLASTSH